MVSMDARLRVLLVTEASSAGVGRHLMDLTEGLVEGGHRVEVVYSPVRSEPAFLERLRALPRVIAHALPMRRAPHPTDLSARRRLRAIVRGRGPWDIVHVHSTKAGLVGRGLGGLVGARTVYTPHCLYTMNPGLGVMERWTVGHLERALAPGTDALIAVSPDELEHARASGLQPRRLVCIPNGVARLAFEGRAQARAQLGLPAGPLLVGFLGRLSAQKDPLRLLDAFAHLLETWRGPTPELAIAGTGPLEGEARAYAQRRRIAERVHWLGHQPPERLLPAIDVLCMPSRYEGMPYVLLEAGSAGVPIVCPPVGGTSLCVRPANGTITQDASPGALAAALSRWLEGDEARARLRAHGPAFAAEFSVEVMVERTVALYRELRREASVSALEVALR